MGLKELGGNRSGGITGLPDPRGMYIIQARARINSSTTAIKDYMNAHGASLIGNIGVRETIADVNGSGLFYGALTDRIGASGNTYTLWITIDGVEYQFSGISTDLNSLIVGLNQVQTSFGNTQAITPETTDAASTPPTMAECDVGYELANFVQFKKSLKVEQKVSNRQSVMNGVVYKVF